MQVLLACNMQSLYLRLLICHPSWLLQDWCRSMPMLCSTSACCCCAKRASFLLKDRVMHGMLGPFQPWSDLTCICRGGPRPTDELVAAKRKELEEALQINGIPVNPDAKTKLYQYYVRASLPGIRRSALTALLLMLLQRTT